MPLFQPSNITPSSFAGIGGGTVAAADNISVSWQLNGNVPMTGFKIDIYQGTSRKGGTGGIIIPYPNKIYPTDKSGNPTYYVYQPDGKTWGDWGVVDGGNYTIQITQYWTSSVTNDNFIEQVSQSAFVSRSKPTLSITTASGATIENIIDSVTMTVTAAYVQAQGDCIDWVRWRFYQIQNGNEMLLDDTGAVNTAVLNYSADNMRSGGAYKLVCIVQTENGVQVSNSATFNVSYELPKIEGGFSFDCSDRSSNLLTWSEIYETTGNDIPGVSSDNSYIYSDNRLELPNNSLVTWETKNDEPLNIPTDWSLFWKGSVDFAANYTRTAKSLSLSGYGINGAVFSPDGTKLSIWGYSRVITCGVSTSSIYTSGTKTTDSAVYTVSYCNDGTRCIGGAFGAIYQSTEISTAKVLSSAFNGTRKDVLALGVAGAIKLFRIEDGSATPMSGSVEGEFGEVSSITFSPDGKYLIAAGSKSIEQFHRYGLLDGSHYMHDGSILQGGISDGCVAFSPDGKYLICGTGVYKVSDGVDTIILTQIGSISSNYNACFTPDGKFILSCYLDRNADVRIYQVKDDTVQYIGGVPALYTSCNYVACSPNSNLVFVGGGISNAQAKYFFANTRERSLVSAGNMNVSVGNKVVFGIGGYSTEFTLGIENELILTLLDSYVEDFSFSVNKSSVVLIHNGTSQMVEIDSSLYPQSAISSVSLTGAQTCSWLYITNETAVITEDFSPVWDNHTQFLTHFEEQVLQAGQLNVAENKMDIYRENVETGKLEKLYSAPKEITQIRDFGWITGEKYYYTGYALLDNAYTSANPFTETPVCRNQPYYLLLETTQDKEYPDVYHVVNYWRFGNNISAGSVSNNNTPNFLTNFTKYRLKQPVSRMGKSGTLTALLSNVIGGEYKDTATQMEDLYNISASENTFFLKDMKGNLYMVAVSNPITQTINTKSFVQEVTVSIPWEEVGSTEGISIIQTPNDPNWVGNNDDLAKVAFSVDNATGMLSVEYPDGYSVTQFALNGERLVATTKGESQAPKLSLQNGSVKLKTEK